MQRPSIPVSIRQLRLECSGVVSVELVPCDGARLPAAEPGAHVDLLLPSGLQRSYSLLDAGCDARAWRIAVKREPASRGGSQWFHDVARVGDRLLAAAPANDFTLVDDASASIFIAGGIGITPVLAMIGRLVALGRPWVLHYAARSGDELAFGERLAGWARQGQGRLHVHLSSEGAGRMDVRGIVACAAGDAHLYCCGPSGMIEDFIAASAPRDPATVHYERFAALQAAATDGGFTVQLARDGRSLPVPEGRSILDVLLDAGVDVPYSCTQGVCGSCRISVVEGEPDHRDAYLTDDEKAANDSILVCCSGARSRHLALDL